MIQFFFRLFVTRLGHSHYRSDSTIISSSGRRAGEPMYARERVLAAIPNVRSDYARGIGVLTMTSDRLLFIDTQWVQVSCCRVVLVV